jgi:hypothetical protein
LGPKSFPTMRYANVETSSDVPIKWIKTKRRDRRTMAPNEGVYASPHAKAVRRRKNDRR